MKFLQLDTAGPDPRASLLNAKVYFSYLSVKSSSYAYGSGPVFVKFSQLATAGPDPRASLLNAKVYFSYLSVQFSAYACGSGPK